ncbi:MAG: MEDS domain-containing protein, partial [Nitriliruptorales bacterium]
MAVAGAGAAIAEVWFSSLPLRVEGRIETRLRSACRTVKVGITKADLMDLTDEDVRRLRARMCEQASLFDNPDIYMAGVKDALAALARLHSSQPDPVRARLSAATSPHDHLVEFYERDEFLVDSVVQFLTPPLRAGEAAVVIATREHRDKFEAALTAEGLDVTGAHDRAQLVTLD